MGRPRSGVRRALGRATVAALLAVAFGASAGTPAAFAAGEWQDLVKLPVGWVSSVQFVDAERGWLTAGWPYRTSDGGRTWQPGEVSGGDALWADTTFYDADHGWMVGDNLAATTSDGGAHWTVRPLTGLGLGESDFATHVWFVDATHGWIAGDFGIARTVDGGAHWKLQNTGDFGSYEPSAVRFSDTMHGCAVNEAGMPR